MSNSPCLPSARRAILETLPDETSLHGQAGDVRFTHVPASHAKALHPDTQLVVGMRGAGKSFWWAALQRPEHRALIAQVVPRVGLKQDAKIAVGFGESPRPGDYPSADVIKQVLDQGRDPRLIWRTIILKAFEMGEGHGSTVEPSWSDRVGYVSDHPEDADRFLASRDQELSASDTYQLVLFDALDRAASDWPTMNQLVRGLLQALLDLRPYRRLRAKCFLRTDQLDEQEVATFPDASKVLAGKVELTWPAHELYGLFFQYLGNATDAPFRREVEQAFSIHWEEATTTDTTAWIPSETLRRDESLQRKVLHAITGPWMGRDRRRGFPYTWIPNHLADAEGRTSPRSFIAALRKSAEDSQQRYPDHSWPLHYESIKRGVQEASRIRVQELQEDYPWVQEIMKPLRGTVVPCLFDEVEAAWETAGVLAGLRSKLQQDQVRLPPEHLDQGHQGLRQDLEGLGIFLRLRDGRANVPDVFRVGYGLGRRGGVRPIRPGGS